MQKQKIATLIVLVTAACSVLAMGIKIGKTLRPPASAPPTLTAEGKARQETLARQAEEDRKFWAQKERVSSHVTIEHSQKERDTAQKQQNSLLNTVRATATEPARNVARPKSP